MFWMFNTGRRNTPQPDSRILASTSSCRPGADWMAGIAMTADATIAENSRIIEGAGMTATGMLARLQSPSMETRIEATYELDYSDFAHPQIVAAVRENLSSADPDLLDITIIRLMVRGKDNHSLPCVLTILETTRDDLVFSSAVLALSALAKSNPETAATTLQKLEALPKCHIATANVSLLNDTVAELRRA